MNCIPFYSFVSTHQTAHVQNRSMLACKNVSSVCVSLPSAFHFPRTEPRTATHIAQRIASVRNDACKVPAIEAASALVERWAHPQSHPIHPIHGCRTRRNSKCTTVDVISNRFPDSYAHKVPTPHAFRLSSHSQQIANYPTNSGACPLVVVLLLPINIRHMPISRPSRHTNASSSTADLDTGPQLCTMPPHASTHDAHFIIVFHVKLPPYAMRTTEHVSKLLPT